MIPSSTRKDETITFMEKQMTNYQISVAIFCYINQLRKKCKNITKNITLLIYLYIIPINDHYG